jgi:hypothetical protein
MRSAKLTKKEVSILKEVERRVTEENEGWVKRCCFMNAQRAALAADGCLLYHEGHVTGTQEADADGRMHHAWNTINGKLVDFSSPLHFDQQHMVAEYYTADYTFTLKEILAAFCKRGNWNWVMPKKVAA